MQTTSARATGDERMRHRLFTRILVTCSLVAASFAIATPAHALFHLMKLTEVFAGTSSQPTAQFIEMQMFAANQRFLASHEVVVYDASGAEKATYTFTGPVDNGDDQAYVLIATPDAEELFGVEADLAMTPDLVAGGGKACFVSSDGNPIDCASWGNYSGDQEGTGTPFNSPAGLIAGQSMERKTSGGENPDGLDAEDDTDNSANDFELASPSPTNNAGNAAQTEEHERSITLKLRSRSKLVASGRVTSDFEECAAQVRVKIQRKRSSGFKTVAKTSTDASGAYKTAMRKRSGRYRAKAPAHTASEGHECLVAVSRTRRV